MFCTETNETQHLTETCWVDHTSAHHATLALWRDGISLLARHTDNYSLSPWFHDHNWIISSRSMLKPSSTILSHNPELQYLSALMPSQVHTCQENYFNQTWAVMIAQIGQRLLRIYSQTSVEVVLKKKMEREQSPRKIVNYMMIMSLRVMCTEWLRVHLEAIAWKSSLNI